MVVDRALSLNAEYAAAENAFVLRFAHTTLAGLPGPHTRDPRRLHRGFTTYCEWAWRTAEIALDPQVLFDIAVIDYFFATEHAHLHRSERALRRNDLVFIARNSDPPIVSRPAVATSVQFAPYSLTEQVGIINWARGQSTAERRRNALALITLGL